MSPRGHNHPPYCMCEFCQPSKLSKESHVTADLFSTENTRRSYTVPMVCSACGNAVFLYQSKHGGRAIFDELGPPWPKHPCSDGARAVRLTASVAADQSLPTRRYSWQEAGWLPITDMLVDSVGSNHVRLHGTHNSQLLTLYIPLTTVDACTDPITQIADSPIHARRMIDGTYELAFLTEDFRHVLTKAFTQPPDAQ